MIDRVAIAPLLLLAAAMPALALSWDSDCSKEKGLFTAYNTVEPLKSLRNAVREFPNKQDDQGTFFRTGMYHRGTHNYPKLDLICKDAIKKHPTWASPYFLLALAAEDQLDDEEALEYYKTAMGLKPCWANLLVAYSRLLIDATRYKDGLDVSNQGIARYKNHPSAESQIMYYHLLQSKGLALVSLHRGAEAVPVFQEALAICPDRHKQLPRERLAVALMATQQWQKAIQLLTINLDEPVADHLVYLKRAKCYSAIGQLDKAQTDIKTFLIVLQRRNLDSESKQKQRREAYTLSAEIYDKFGKKDLAEKQRKLVAKETKDFYDNAPFRTH